MPRARKKTPKLTPEDYIDKLSELRSKQLSPDRKDYMRTIVGRGDTHALDGGKIPVSKTKRSLQKAKQYKEMYANAQKKHDVGQGYAGLGKQELKNRQYQAKLLTKKAGGKADEFEWMANQLATGGYVDLFGDEKWLRKQAAGYRKTQAQWDKQYSKLHR